MRKLKGSGNYLRNQTWKNLAKAILCLTLFGIIFLSAIVQILFYSRVGLFEESLLGVSLVPLATFYYFLHRYHIYRGGWEGERLVAKLLNETLNDDYYLINGVRIRGEGDIDHIILGPTGIFVIETKNWSGKIICNGDNWQRDRKRGFASNPSKQLRRNVSQVKDIVDHLKALNSIDIPVGGVLVFTNKHADLHLNKPTVPVLRINELPKHIKLHGGKPSLADNISLLIGKELLKKAL